MAFVSAVPAIPMSLGVPRVRVPVLSNATVVIDPSCSMTTADLTNTPWRPALAIAANSGGMVASTTAQLKGNALAGNYCISVADPNAALTDAIKYSVTVAHP